MEFYIVRVVSIWRYHRGKREEVRVEADYIRTGYGFSKNAPVQEFVTFDEAVDTVVRRVSNDYVDVNEDELRENGCAIFRDPNDFFDFEVRIDIFKAEPAIRKEVS